MRRFLFFLLVVSALLSIPSIAKRFTHGFRLAKMRLEFPHHPEWEIEPNQQVNEILNQPFSFLGKGAQCYAFESKDGAYVIKLFRYDQPPKEEKIIDLFNACKLAYDQLRSETGLVYIHLNPTPMNLPAILCKDAVGRRYQFDLNRCRFALQKKAKSFRQTMVEAQNNPEQMQKRIDEFLALLKARTAKGVINTDPQLSRNFGFLDDQAIEFDFGNYRLSSAFDQKREIERYSNRLRGWMKRHASDWVGYLDARVDAL